MKVAMRQVSSPIHRNLAASKRSIVIICAAIALVLGTTSVGTSFFMPGQLGPPATTNSIPSDYDQIAPAEQPLSTVTNTLLGIQQPLYLGPNTQTTAGRVGVEAGPVSPAAVITQIKKIAKTPVTTDPAPSETTPPAAPSNPTTTAAPTAPTTSPVTPPPADPAPEQTPPADPPTPSQDPAPSADAPMESLSVQDTSSLAATASTFAATP